MKKQQESMLVLAIMTAFVAASLLLPRLLRAGDLDPSAPPGPTMHTLDEIYDIVQDTYSKAASGQCERAPVEKTGQTTSHATGDDGDLQVGVAWPNPRFTDNGDGTVTDNLTGLMWLKNADCIPTQYPGFDNDGISGDGRVTWQHALDFVAGINDGIYPNCGAGYADWRLPNAKELHSLIHFEYYIPALPNTAGTGQWSEGDPFTSIQPSYYWSSNTCILFNPQYAWMVALGVGYVMREDKSVAGAHVWCVRGGQ